MCKRPRTLQVFTFGIAAYAVYRSHLRCQGQVEAAVEVMEQAIVEKDKANREIVSIKRRAARQILMMLCEAAALVRAAKKRTEHAIRQAAKEDGIAMSALAKAAKREKEIEKEADEKIQEVRAQSLREIDEAWANEVEIRIMADQSTLELRLEIDDLRSKYEKLASGVREAQTKVEKRNQHVASVKRHLLDLVLSRFESNDPFRAALMRIFGTQ